MDNHKNCTFCYTEIDPRAVKFPNCQSRQADAPPFHRGVPGKIFGGVCAGISAYFGFDVSLVRVAFAFASLISGGLVCSAYAMLWLITPPSVDGLAPVARFIEAVRRLFTPTPVGPTQPSPQS